VRMLAPRVLAASILVAGLVLPVAGVAATVAAATANPKVVIIVGPVGSVTRQPPRPPSTRRTS